MIEGANVQVVALTDGVSQQVQAAARKAVCRAARLAPTPVLHARVWLARPRGPAARLPATAQAILDVNGVPVRVRATARDLQAAVDELDDRLRARLRHLAGRSRARRRVRSARAG